MTAVAPPLTFQPAPRTGWSSNNSLNGLSHEELTRALNMQQNTAPRKTTQRSNSSSSLSSATSTSSTLSTASTLTSGSAPQSNQANGTAISDSHSTRKKGRQMFVPIGKSEPTAGLSTARPMPVSSASSGPSAASTISALHVPMLPSQQMPSGILQPNGNMNGNGTIRNSNIAHEPTAILHLLPMNATFERKTITVPFFPDVLRIGRQTNQKTAPTPSNAFFDSKVLSRQHAEIYAERNSGRVFIRDVKSSNGTFVNGQRLSPENKESEPHPLQEQDVLELGIDIVSEDQKTVVHHKVAARVEHAGIYTPADMAFNDLDPSALGSMVAPNQNMKRSGSQSSAQSAKANALAAVMQARDVNGLSHFQQPRTMYTPITTETIVKRLNRELNLAKLQSQDLARSKQCLESLINGDYKKSRSDIKSPFPDPPAPPPQQPLPEKPDVAKALADPVIQPLLLRADNPRASFPPSASPTRADHSHALLILTQELKLAKDQIPSLEDRVKLLETELKLERTARESAEERAHKLEVVNKSESADDSASDPVPIPNGDTSETMDAREMDAEKPDLQTQLERLLASMDEMKQHMEAYRQRAEAAESERDGMRQTLAEMIEQKRRENSQAERGRSQSRHSRINSPVKSANHKSASNGHTIEPKNNRLSVAALLEDAGVHNDEFLTTEHVATLRQVLAKHSPQPFAYNGDQSDVDVNAAAKGITKYNTDRLPVAFADYAWYWGPAITALVIGALAMAGLDKIEAVHRFVMAKPDATNMVILLWERARREGFKAAYRNGRALYADYTRQ